MSSVKLLFAFVQWILGVEAGVGYTFSSSGDPGNPNPNAACLHRDMDDARDVIIAHRTLPCKTPVFVYSVKTGRGLWAIVGDRGPYGRRKDGSYRGVVDMSPVVNRRLKTKGRAAVLLFPAQGEISWLMAARTPSSGSTTARPR